MTDTDTLTTGWEATAPIADSIVRQLVFAYADRVAWMARAVGGAVDRDADACIADVGSSFGYDNAAVLLRPPLMVELGEILGRARTLFTDQRWWVLFSAWPPPDLRSQGLALVGHPPLMLRSPGAVASASPVGLRIIEVHDHTTLTDFGAVLTAGFPLPGGGGVADTRLLGGRLRLYVGYLDDQPVATAGASVAHGIVEVDWIATLPQFRSRGIATAMTAAAVSADCTLPAVLLASDQGHDIYRRLGFIDVLRCTIWEHRPRP